jgi:large-conductance mechanosensitive channel
MFGLDFLSLAIGVVVGGACMKCVAPAVAYLKDNWLVKLVINFFKKENTTDPK